jgi:hypothetical protein
MIKEENVKLIKTDHKTFKLYYPLFSRQLVSGLECFLISFSMNYHKHKRLLFRFILIEYSPF